MLSDERDTRITLHQILIQSAIEDRESQVRVRFHDALEELAGYY